MALGWFSNLADAVAYFASERLVTKAWDDLSAADKPKAVTNAYNRIYYDKRYDVPTYADATVAQKVILRIVNGEMAYYLAMHLASEDRRMGLRAQGVIKAGIVKEDYKDDLAELPIPPQINAMLEDAGFTTEKAFGMVDLDRDEDKSVDEKVDEF